MAFLKTTEYTCNDVATLVRDPTLQFNDESLVSIFRQRIQEYEPAWLSEDGDPEVPKAERDADPPKQGEHPVVWLQSIRRQVGALLADESDASHIDSQKLKQLDKAIKKVLSDEWLGSPSVYAHRVRPTEPELLELLRSRERVHPTDDADTFLKRALPPRRMFSLEHPAVGRHRPSAFVCTALVQSREREAGSIPYLLSLAPWFPIESASTAIFYSISSIEPGLAGVGVAKRLLQSVLDGFVQQQVDGTLPLLTNFLTLSPLPNFRSYLIHRLQLGDLNLPNAQLLEPLLQPQVRLGAEQLDLLPAQLKAMLPLLKKQVLDYVLQRPAEQNSSLPRDPVANFHLGNGASLAGIHFLGDTSNRRLGESLGFMVNYEYNPEKMAERAQRYRTSGAVDVVDSLRDFL